MFICSHFHSYHGWLHHKTFSSRVSVDLWLIHWVLTPFLALCHAPEVVGIPEAAPIIETLALLTFGVKEVSSDQASAGTRSFRQMTWVLVLCNDAGLLTGFHSIKVVVISPATSIFKYLTVSCVNIEVVPLLDGLAGSWIVLLGAYLVEDQELRWRSI